MQEFNDLTKRAQGLRLRSLAINVLSQDYGYIDADMTLLSMHSFNTMFRVRVDDRKFVLRVGDACRIHAVGVEDIEAKWLASLCDAGFGSPRNIPTSNGRHWTTIARSGVPEPRNCSLFTWVKGRPLSSHLAASSSNRELMMAAGALLAQLHGQAAGHDHGPIPPEVIADRVVYFHEENRVVDYQSRHGGLFAEAIDRVQRFLDDLWRSPPHRPHLLHGDFGVHNVLVHRGRLNPIDFQDLQSGFAVQDVALTIADLQRSRPELVEPFRVGYESSRPWPELTPPMQEVFSAARSLNVMNLGLHLRRAGFADRLDDHAARIAKWMTGHEA